MRKFWKRAILMMGNIAAVITFRILTEAGDTLTTEAGDPLQTE